MHRMNSGLYPEKKQLIYLLVSKWMIFFLFSYLKINTKIRWKVQIWIHYFILSSGTTSKDLKGEEADKLSKEYP